MLRKSIRGLGVAVVAKLIFAGYAGATTINLFASMDGAQLEVELRLPEGPIRVKSTVIYANVPGNLQRPNLPLGMAVRFEKLDGPTSKQLKRYVKTRCAGLTV